MVLDGPRGAGVALQIADEAAGLAARDLDGVIAVRRGQRAAIRGEGEGDGGNGRTARCSVRREDVGDAGPVGMVRGGDEGCLCRRRRIIIGTTTSHLRLGGHLVGVVAGPGEGVAGAAQVGPVELGRRAVLAELADLGGDGGRGGDGLIPGKRRV